MSYDKQEKQRDTYIDRCKIQKVNFMVFNSFGGCWSTTFVNDLKHAQIILGLKLAVITI